MRRVRYTQTFVRLGRKPPESDRTIAGALMLLFIVGCGIGGGWGELPSHLCLSDCYWPFSILPIKGAQFE